MSLTVNIISYKYGHFAAQAVDSVLCQTKRPDVIRLIDDGAGDCRRVAEAYPEVEFIERPQNLGTVANLQNILDRTDTDRSMTLGADNWMRPDALEVLTQFAHDIVSCDLAITGTEGRKFAHLVGANQRFLGHHVWRFKPADIRQRNYIHGSSIFNVKAAKKFGYRASGRTNTEEDWMLWMDMLTNGHSHRHHPEPLIYYRRHRQSFTQLD